MKYLIASDIHGSAFWCGKLMEAYKTEKADRLLLLGDILYHGPRNALPEDYDPPKVADMLNGIKEDILCIRGNCEADVDSLVLEFCIRTEHAVIDLGKTMIFATHGHTYNTSELPALHKGDILLYGHTHVPACEEYEEYIYMNPGSVSIPKEGSWHGYMTLEDGEFLWKDLSDGTVRKRFEL